MSLFRSAIGTTVSALAEARTRRAARRWRRRKIAAFEQAHGRSPDFDAPRTFSEKLLKRILNDEDPMYRVYGVKLHARDFVEARGIEGLRVARQLNVVRHCHPTAFRDLPESFVMKSSFGSGLNEIVPSKAALDVEAVCEKFNRRLHSLRNAQGSLDPHNVIIFEEYLGEPDAGPPDDYKFHCFNGSDGSFHCFVQIDTDRFGDHRQTVMDERLRPISLRFEGSEPHDTPPEPSSALPDMLRIVRELSRGFDYIRVDLFDVHGEIYFGELTPFHRGGMSRITPFEWEEELGRIWDQRFPIYQPWALEMADQA